MSRPLQTLPGFRDFPPRECAARNHVFDEWRRAAAAYGFVEWEGPVLESTELYRRKSGDEIVNQLFAFSDKGGREVALRPELTPTLARVVAAGHQQFKKPLKWFEIGACFRYEAPQKGRLREFYQWNCDIVGEASVEADAELIALGIDLLRRLGFTAREVGVRLSDRGLWDEFVERARIGAERVTAFLQVIDKWEREEEGKTEARLRELGTTREAVAAFMEEARGGRGRLDPLVRSLEARGLGDYVAVDPGIVRGLAYYTGTVFEFFSKGEGLRAIAGGGRYDRLCSVISDGAVDLPAVGFAMGDVVLARLIEATPAAMARLQESLGRTGIEVFVVVADEARRPEALALLQRLREAGLRADHPLAPMKVGRQFQAAEALRARVAVIVGAEFPQVKVKDLQARVETPFSAGEVVQAVKDVLAREASPPLLA